MDASHPGRHQAIRAPELPLPRYQLGSVPANGPVQLDNYRSTVRISPRGMSRSADLALLERFASYAQVRPSAALRSACADSNVLQLPTLACRSTSRSSFVNDRRQRAKSLVRSLDSLFATRQPCSLSSVVRYAASTMWCHG
jgi:hypothetical protein